MKLHILLLTIKHPHILFVTVKRFIFAWTEEPTAIIFFIRLSENSVMKV